MGIVARDRKYIPVTVRGAASAIIADGDMEKPATQIVADIVQAPTLGIRKPDAMKYQTMDPTG
jgi:hypothetical protein